MAHSALMELIEPFVEKQRSATRPIRGKKSVLHGDSKRRVKDSVYITDCMAAAASASAAAERCVAYTVKIEPTQLGLHYYSFCRNWLAHSKDG